MAWTEAGSAATAAASRRAAQSLERPRLPGWRGGGSANRAVSRRTWPMTSWPRRRAVRISEPRMYQASSSRHEGADGAQQALGDRELAGVARTAAQAGDQRHRARSIPTWHDGGQRDETLGQQERRAVGFGRVVEADRNTRRLSRAPGPQRVVNHDEAPPHPNLTPDNPAQRRYQAEQPEPFEHPVVSLPAEPRRQSQDRLRDARRQHGADDQLQNRQSRGLRAGLHDLLDPSAKGRREAGLVMRFHGVYGRLVSHPLHENRLPGDTLFRNPHRPSNRQD